MKRLLFVLPVLLLAFCACDKQDIEMTVDTTLNVVDIGLEVWGAKHDAACTAGTATPAECAKWATLWPKLLESKNTMVMIWGEYLAMKDQANTDRLKRALVKLNDYIRQIKALVNAWAPKHTDEILRRLRLPPDVLRAVAVGLRS